MYSRTELLIGSAGLAKLKRARVLVCGIGGVGSYAAEALVRAGVGHLVLIDYDTIDVSNLNRQIHALNSTVGKEKIQVMAQRLKDINPHLELELHPVFLTPENVSMYLDGELDYVVDAIDNVAAKVALLASAYRRGIPIISSMGMGNRLDPTKIGVTDIGKTYGCPLAKVVRKRLREMGVHKGIPVVFSTEPAHKPQVSTEGRIPPGSISFVPPVAGFFLAGAVVNHILTREDSATTGRNLEGVEFLGGGI
ncbi:MAG: tRNA threonylcarbamoyladenosine dehydratase [Limnochordia bacterium]|jgi:tRNA A37 threonylcarbamoyladenosine dehydratase